MVGLTIARALVRRLPHKGVTTYPPQVAEAGFIGTLLLALVAQRTQAHPVQLGQPQRLAGEAVPAHVHLDITGCLIMAVGVCPMVQLAVAMVALHQPHLLQPLQHLNQPHLQLNLNQPPPHKIQHLRCSQTMQGLLPYGIACQ